MPEDAPSVNDPDTEPTVGDSRPGPDPQDVPFTPPRSQREFDQMLGRRLQEERQKFAGYADYKAKAERFDELEQQQMSELERAQTAATEATQRAEHAEWSLVGATIRAAVIAEASKAGAVDPESVAMLLAPDAVTIDDAGQVTNAESAVADLLAAKPFLVGPQHPPPANFDGGARSDGSGNGSGQPWQVRSREELKGKTPEQIEELRLGGHLNELQGITT